jgi:hypothetical protein
VWAGEGAVGLICTHVYYLRESLSRPGWGDLAVRFAKWSICTTWRDGPGRNGRAI